MIENDESIWWRMNKYHCEKTSFATAFLFAVLIGSLVLILTTGAFFLANDLVLIFSIALIAGVGGIIYYSHEGEKSLIPPGILMIVALAVIFFAPLYTQIEVINCITVPCDNPTIFVSLFDKMVQFI